MSNLSLIRVDQPEQNEVTLPKGETLLGRGSILGCDDKRISRKHGSLQVSEDGIITLVSLHTNPCFYKAQNLDKYAVLLKGQSKVLHDGDEFALLPSSFQYRVVVKPKVEDAQPVSFQTEVPCITHKEDNENKDHATIGDKETSHSAENGIQDVTNPMPCSPCTTSPNRKRVLPEWLTNLPGSGASSSAMKATTSTSSTAAVKAKRKASTAEPVEKKAKTNIKEELSDVSIKIETEVDDVVSIADAHTATVTPTSRVPAEGQARDQLSTDEEDVKPKKDGYEAEYGAASSAAARTPDVNAAGTPTREPCVYGATCYRKNPQHRQDFSHPGDADYSISQDLPECPYGTACYRKNLQHRRDYKHTQQPIAPPMPAPQATGDPTQTRTKRRTTTKTTDDSSEDDYDYDDPFLNDGSSDDYEPTSSEDSDNDEDEDDDQESQDRRRMIKEAKKFTKRQNKKRKLKKN